MRARISWRKSVEFTPSPSTPLTKTGVGVPKGAKARRWPRAGGLGGRAAAPPTNRPALLRAGCPADHHRATFGGCAGVGEPTPAASWVPENHFYKANSRKKGPQIGLR